MLVDCRLEAEMSEEALSEKRLFLRDCWIMARRVDGTCLGWCATLLFELEGLAFEEEPLEDL